jgi:uncharacterized protein DUF3352
MTKSTRYFMAGSAAVMAAGLSIGLIAFYGGGFQALSASTGPMELIYVPSDAAVVAYADVRTIMDSELRQQLKAAMPMHESGQQEFQDKTGIDIERDIDYVVAAMTPGSQARPTGLVVARGRFNDVQLETLAREHGGTLEDYKGKRLITSPENQTEQFTIAFLEPGLVAVGDSAVVKHAIDAQLSAQSITSNSEMMELVKDIERSNNAWAVGRLDVLTSQAKLPDEIALRIPAVKLFAAAGHINGGVSGSLRAEARDEQAAQQLRDIVRGFLAFAQLQSQNDPKLAALSQSLQLSGDGTTVALSFTVPAELLQMMAPKVAQ